MLRIWHRLGSRGLLGWPSHPSGTPDTEFVIEVWEPQKFWVFVAVAVPQDQETLETQALSSSPQVLAGLLVVRTQPDYKAASSYLLDLTGFFHSAAFSDHWPHLHQPPLLSEQAAAMVAQIRQADKPPPGHTPPS